MRVIFSALILCLLLAGIPLPTKAGQLTNRRDVLGTSAINTESSHYITFKPTIAIPSSGTITITPAANVFTVHPQLDYRDIDIKIDGNEQHVLPTAGSGSGSAWGAVITTGLHGHIVLTLNDTDTVPSGSTVEILVGAIAIYEAAGSFGIINPNVVGSYPIHIETATASSTPLDASIIGVAITIPVGITGTQNGNSAENPAFNPTPGTYANNALISITTSTPGATIYYTTDGTTPNTSSIVYTGAFTISQSTVIQAFATAPGYTDSGVTTGTYTITSSGEGGNAGGGGAPVVIPPFIPPAGASTINGNTGGLAFGRCSNGSTISLTIPAGAWRGNGYVTLSCFPYSTFENKTGAVTGEALADTIFGISITDDYRRPITLSAAPIEATLTYTPGQYAGFTQPFTLQQFHSNRWDARAHTENKNAQTIFKTTFTTIGSVATIGTHKNQSCASRPADINCDLRVDIVDFSILLYWWKSTASGIRADINKDGIVNLIDFNILLYWWTG